MDDIGKLKQQFIISLGGEPTIISGINDTETAVFMVDSQRELKNLKNQNNKPDDNIYTDMEKSIQKLRS